MKAKSYSLKYTPAEEQLIKELSAIDAVKVVRCKDAGGGVMERLTERWGEDDVWVKDHDYVSAAHRLAAYEDTGLTPEQCENAKAIIESAFSDDTSKAERIRELLKADKAGCVVVLPCKVGKRLNGKNKKED